jgi:hypothetical protein
MAAHENMLSTLDLLAFTSAAAAALFLLTRGRSAGESISISSSSTPVVAVVVRLGPSDLPRRCRSERMNVCKFLDGLFSGAGAAAGVAANSSD